MMPKRVLDNFTKRCIMIKKTKQTWEVGHQVKVGFLTLLVVDKKATPGDYLPDAYLLKAINKETYYEFIPHNGLNKLDSKESFN